MTKRISHIYDREPVRAPLDGTLITRAAFTDPHRAYQMCETCVMDTTDPDISFNEDGACSYCESLQEIVRKTQENAKDRLPKSLDIQLSRNPRGAEYDCILGMSGGVDSSFLLHKVVSWGLKPLVVHVDGGWNSEVAVSNIHKLVTALNVDLVTEVIDWKTMSQLQLAFLRSGLANLDAPQDHAFFASLFKIAARERIRLILSGHNLATESINPRWGYDAMDGRLLRAVNKKFGGGSLRNFAVMSLPSFRVFWPKIYGFRNAAPLNDIPYSKEIATNTLSETYGWVDYGQKHFESVWTRYFQAVYLPYRFGYDKRKSHLSSRILSGEITREFALEKLSEPLYPAELIARDEHFISSKLNIDFNEFAEIKDGHLGHESDFPNDNRLMTAVYRLMALRKSKRNR